MPHQRRWRFGGACLPGLAALTVLLTACQQPTPGVTLQSGSHVVRSSATVYERGGKQVREREPVKVLTVQPGAQVGIDVDRKIVARGWSVYITTGPSGGSTVKTSVLRGHHFSFDFGSVATDVVVSEQGTGSSPQGLWAFRLEPAAQ